MNRYLLLEDGAADVNAQTMQLLAKDKQAGWIVSNVVDVRVTKAADGSLQETDAADQGLRAAKIVLT